MNIVPKSISDPILSILKKYERDPDRNNKKAVLLTPQNGYFLCGNRFCSLLDYELEWISDSCQIQGNSVQKALFFGVMQDGFQTAGEKIGTPELVSLIFHIDLGGEDEPLRGILLAAGAECRFALFCDAAVEELYRLSRRVKPGPDWSVPPDEELRQQAEQLRRNDLHGLTGFYLQSQRLKLVADRDKLSLQSYL